MRPVNKKEVGDSIVLDNGTVHIVREDYHDYHDARPVLLANFGHYCSYCEDCFKSGTNLQTEHVQPKGLEVSGVKPYAELSTKWDNFLLGCATCNGKGNKGSKDVELDNIHLPHRNNTYLSLVYKEAGVVIPNPQLSGKSLSNAKALISLVGLDKEDSDTDGRCGMRRDAWRQAVTYLDDYENGEMLLRHLIDFIKVYGCWSIWFTVFKEHREVREALVEQFPGTSRECFDGDFNPIHRHPENQEDPI